MEDELMSHPKFAEVATIAVVRLVRRHLSDDVVLVPEVLTTSVGNFSRKSLREQFADCALPVA